MSRRSGDAFERVLVWYPARWRESNGDVLVGALRDHAEHENRTRPSRGEVLSAVGNGLALRMDPRVALWSSVIALILSALVWLFGLQGTYAGIVTTGVAPALTLLGVIALLRSRGRITPPRALLTLVVLTGALILAVLAQLSWARGFDLADAGIALSGLAAAFMPLFISGWIAGGAGVALFIDGVLAPTRMPRGGRIVLAGVLGAVTAPVLGVGLINPVMSSVIALTVAVVALRTVDQRDVMPAPPLTSSPLTYSSSSPAQWLGWISVAGGLAGVAYALSGAAWSTAATDGTVAMGQGITIMLASSIPLIAAVGLDASKRRGHLVVWGPLCAAALAVIAVAIAYVHAPEWAGMGVWMTSSAVLGGVALGWWITPRLRGPIAARVAVGVASGAAYAALVGIAVIPSLAFTIPVLGTIVALRSHRRRHARSRSRRTSQQSRATQRATA